MLYTDSEGYREPQIQVQPPLKEFRFTAKQYEAINLMAAHMYVLLVGGSRSGKTFIMLRNIIIRALAVTSKHAVFRLRFSHVKRAIVGDTLPAVMKLCFPQLVIGVHYILNKTDWYVKFLENGSTIWFGGLDDKERTDKILGTEYSTLYFNECTDMGYENIETALTRLAENSGLPLSCWFDCNPTSVAHWSYRMFLELKHPVSGKELSLSKYAHLFVNPLDNKQNLSQAYFDDILDNLSTRKRLRFKDGKYQTEVEGALWNMQMLAAAAADKDDVKDFKRELTIVTIDPTVSNETSTNDECGLGVISKDTKKRTRDGHALVEVDKSGHYTTLQWPQLAIDLYYKYDADYIIAEKNQGGELVKNVIHNLDPMVKVVLVHASKGKYARAEPVTVLYERDKVFHAPGLDKLEDQLTTYVPSEHRYSPGRLDMLVWGLTWLFQIQRRKSEGIRVRVL